MKDSRAEAAVRYDPTHCPVCSWEIEPSAAKCPFCGADFKEIWQRSSRSHVAINTLLAILKLLYVPAIYWACGYILFVSWMQVLPLYQKDPHLALEHWIGSVHLSKMYMANSILFLFFFALLWIIMCWPNDVNPGGAILNGACTYILFFPVPLLLLLLFKPGLAAPIREMVGATLRYLLF